MHAISAGKVRVFERMQRGVIYSGAETIALIRGDGRCKEIVGAYSADRECGVVIGWCRMC